MFKTILYSHFFIWRLFPYFPCDQYDYHWLRSTGEKLPCLTHLWSSTLRNYEKFCAAVLDISKLFDGHGIGICHCFPISLTLSFLLVSACFFFFLPLKSFNICCLWAISFSRQFAMFFKVFFSLTLFQFFNKDLDCSFTSVYSYSAF